MFWHSVAIFMFALAEYGLVTLSGLVTCGFESLPLCGFSLYNESMFLAFKSLQVFLMSVEGRIWVVISYLTMGDSFYPLFIYDQCHRFNFSTLILRPLIMKISTTDKVHILLVTLVTVDIYGLYILCKANLLIEKFMSTIQLGLNFIHMLLSSTCSRFFLSTSVFLVILLDTKFSINLTPSSGFLVLKFSLFVPKAIW